VIRLLPPRSRCGNFVRIFGQVVAKGLCRERKEEVNSEKKEK
jgi:hypothetical protein